MFPCAVEMDLAQHLRHESAVEARQDHEAQVVAETTEALKAEVLAAIQAGDMSTEVSCVSSFGKPSTMTLDEAVFEALASAKAQPLLAALLKSEAGKALAEFIAREHAATYGDALGLVEAGAL